MVSSEFLASCQRNFDQYQAFWRHLNPSDQTLAKFYCFLQDLHKSPSIHHFTSSALIVDASQSQTLLTFHKKIQAWVQPGGHLEEQESPEQACIREVAEETGLIFHHDFIWHPALLTEAGEPCPLHLSIFEVPAWSGQPAHQHFDLCFLLQVAEVKAIDETLGWFSLADELDLESSSDAGLMALVKKFKHLL